MYSSDHDFVFIVEGESDLKKKRAQRKSAIQRRRSPRIREADVKADVVDALRLVAQLHGRKARIEGFSISPCGNGADISVQAKFVK